MQSLVRLGDQLSAFTSVIRHVARRASLWSVHQIQPADLVLYRNRNKETLLNCVRSSLLRDKCRNLPLFASLPLPRACLQATPQLDRLPTACLSRAQSADHGSEPAPSARRARPNQQPSRRTPARRRRLARRAPPDRRPIACTQSLLRRSLHSRSKLAAAPPWGRSRSTSARSRLRSGTALRSQQRLSVALSRHAPGAGGACRTQPPQQRCIAISSGAHGLGPADRLCQRAGFTILAGCRLCNRPHGLEKCRMQESEKKERCNPCSHMPPCRLLRGRDCSSA
jgi:hypothetical protein